jgi:hypothetical protein
MPLADVEAVKPLSIGAEIVIVYGPVPPLTVYAVGVIGVPAKAEIVAGPLIASAGIVAVSVKETVAVALALSVTVIV